jgi:hypothetical protein
MKTGYIVFLKIIIPSLSYGMYDHTSLLPLDSVLWSALTTGMWMSTWGTTSQKGYCHQQLRMVGLGQSCFFSLNLIKTILLGPTVVQAAEWMASPIFQPHLTWAEMNSCEGLRSFSIALLPKFWMKCLASPWEDYSDSSHISGLTLFEQWLWVVSVFTFLLINQRWKLLLIV